MRLLPSMALGCAVTAMVASLAPAQKEQRATLTSAEIEQIREAGIDPDQRIKLYTQFLDERADRLQKLSGRIASGARSKRIDDELLDFTSLMDELGSNLDQYGDREADMRKSLKTLNEAVPKWQAMLKAVPSEPVFMEARKEAMESAQDLAQQTSQLYAHQLDYFKTHKDAKGQERAEPQ